MIFLLERDATDFPPYYLAQEDGLLAVGGNLSATLLKAAYSNGIFPWYDSRSPIMWYAPNPRFVLFPAELHISRSMAKLMKRSPWRVTTNACFAVVIDACQKTRESTWITEEMKEAYIALHELGAALSVEVWDGEELVGGLYGLRVNSVFCGESMFSFRPNASKFGFIKFVQASAGLRLIDCQMRSEYLESLGGKYIGMKEYLEILRGMD